MCVFVFVMSVEFGYFFCVLLIMVLVVCKFFILIRILVCCSEVFKFFGLSFVVCV